MAGKKKAKADPEVNEIAVLFPEEQVGPYTLRPWSLDQFMNLIQALLKMMEGFITLGLTEANAAKFMQRPMTELMPALIPILPEVLAVTLRLTPAQVAEINIGRQAALGIKILWNLENQEQIKNFLADFFGEKKSAAATPSASPAP